MKKLLLLLASTVIIITLITLMYTASQSRQKSSELMDQFKAIDESLTASSDSIQKRNDSLLQLLNSDAVKKDSAIK